MKKLLKLPLLLITLLLIFSLLSCSNSNINADAKKACELISELNFLEIENISSKYNEDEWMSALRMNCDAADMLLRLGETFEENSVEFIDEFSDEFEGYAEEMEKVLEGYEVEMEKVLETYEVEMEEALSELEDAFDY